MKKEIKVKCLLGYKEYKNNKEKTLLAIVEEGEDYRASLSNLSHEYLAKDSEGRRFLVGELDDYENLLLHEEFKLID